MTVIHVSSCNLPTAFGLFRLHGFSDKSLNKEHLVLEYGSVETNNPVLLRIHSECLTGDTFFSLKCDCGNQLEASLQRIAQAGSGMLIYLRQEGRGIGILNKIKAYQLQDQGKNTVEANTLLGFAPDERNYSIAVAILNHFSIKSVDLITNNPKKINGLQSEGIEVVSRVAIETEITPENKNYLQTKAELMGHIFSKI